ncbi:acyl-CoA dehydrogenase family protein [Paenibacillus zanthoxyli]|uniref:acyl-CoA dehydrogenase family protein n=1 Tax=Paenibacillus zanthoxyli TaxID=369399 RepID=UPI00047271AF|nr:acyl-CoA dehydrogenase family protein [Paenibacillus zanthoxyli]
MTVNEMQQIVEETAANFIKTFVEPAAGEIDEQETFPMSNMKEMGRLGLLGIPFPEEYEGLDQSFASYISFVRQLAGACASTAMTVVAHTCLTGHPIHAFGSPLQKAAHLSRLATGEAIGAFALTEPDSGSDMASMRTRAVEHDDHYVLNGSKTFITNANVADIYVVAASTAPDKKMLGLTLFIVEKGMEGVSTSSKKERKLGMRGADMGELIFENVIIPKENVIGRKNFGLEVLHATLASARIGMAAIAVGIAEEAQRHCLQYVKQRKQFDQYLYQFQTIKNMLADMEVNLNASRLLLERAVHLKDSGKPFAKEASEAKLFASETATRITKDAVQIFGGYGYSRELPLERLFRDAKLTEIGDGTSEIQRLIIADELIKRRAKSSFNPVGGQKL